jgi:hypothetical protein
VDGATEVFTKLQANCVLAPWDSMLRASALSSDEQSTLRALPLEDGSLFGQLVPEFMKGKAESSRDDAFLKVADSPMAPPAATKRPPAKPAQDAPAAKKPKQVLKQKKDKKKKHVSSSSGPSGKPKALPPPPNRLSRLPTLRQRWPLPLILHQASGDWPSTWSSGGL